MNDCIFCKIVKGELPSATVHEDDDTLAFLDIMPINKGHVLVISKKHYETIIDTPKEILTTITSVVHDIATVLMKDADGLTIGQNNLPAGGQVVPHIHFHVMPRYKGDGHKHDWNGKGYEEGEMKIWQDKIKSLLKSR